jgi:hypothetical protein
VTSFADTNERLTGSLDATTILADVLISAVLSTILYRSRTEFAQYVISPLPKTFSNDENCYSTNSLINKLVSCPDRDVDAA